jgi:hypothetical protein
MRDNDTADCEPEPRSHIKLDENGQNGHPGRTKAI